MYACIVLEYSSTGSYRLPVQHTTILVRSRRLSSECYRYWSICSLAATVRHVMGVLQYYKSHRMVVASAPYTSLERSCHKDIIPSPWWSHRSVANTSDRFLSINTTPDKCWFTRKDHVSSNSSDCDRVQRKTYCGMQSITLLFRV